MLKGFVSGVEKDITRIPMLVGSEYREGWEVRDNQGRLIWGREDELQTATGTIPFKGYGLPMKVKSLLGNGQQTGTPTPSAPIQPEFCGNKVGADWTIPFTCAGMTVSVYLGQTQTVRRIKKLVLTGGENFISKDRPDNANYMYVLRVYHEREICVCSHLPYTYDYPRTFLGVRTDASYQLMYMNIGAELQEAQPSGNTVAGFKEYLAAQYAAGTPVTVWYVLAEPETGIVNEPLAKIDDYADELNDTVTALPEIPTTTGQSTLTVDTTLAPSELTIKGHIKELT